MQELSFEAICSLLDGKSRQAIAKCTFGYYDGTMLKLIEGSLVGEIATAPSGKNGFGWDQIFVPKGYSVTRASLNEADDKKTYLQIKPFAELKNFLETLS